PSPSQNGMVDGAPPASSTRTFPLSTLRIRQELLPRRITSPAIDSIAKSSSSVPIGVSSGSSTTWYVPVSGIAPPEVIEISRAPRAPRRPPPRMAMRPPPPPPRPRGDAVGEHVHDGVEVVPMELGIWCGPPAQREEPVLLLVLTGADRHELLGEDVQRRAPE